jgi:hypothetical protein
VLTHKVRDHLHAALAKAGLPVALELVKNVEIENIHRESLRRSQEKYQERE